MKHLLERLLAVLAARIITRYHPTVIAVTGSVGKTATKDAIVLALRGVRGVRGSTGNYNNELGVPLTIVGEPSGGRSVIAWLRIILHAKLLAFWWRDASYPSILVLEFAADKPGDIAALCRLAPPTISVVTAASATHTQAFGTVDAVAREKGEVVAALPADGTAILNADEPPVMEMAAWTTARVVRYGFSPGADIRITRTRFMSLDGGASLPAGLEATIEVDGHPATVTFPHVIADYQLGSVLVALAVARALGLPVQDALSRLADFAPPPGRMELRRGVKGAWLVDDSYNSSPLAARRALETFGALPGSGRRIAVLGEMAELGELSRAAHEELGLQAARVADLIVAVRPAARATLHGALATGFSSDRQFFFPTAEAAGRFLQERIREGDLVLIKGSRVCHLERVVQELRADAGVAS